MESAALLVLTIACFAVSTPLVRVALGGATPASVALIRCAIAAAVLLVAGRRELLRLTRRQVLLTALAGVIFGVHLAFYTSGVAATSIVGAVTMISMEPALVLLASTLVFRAPPTRMEMAGVAVAAVGAYLLGTSGAGPSGEHHLAGDLLVLLAEVFYTVYYVFTRSLRVPALAYAAVTYAAATLTLLPMAALSGPILPTALRPAVAIGLLAVVSTLGGHTILQVATRRLRAALISLVPPGEAMGAVLVSVVMFGTLPGPSEALACAFVVAGAAVVGMGRRADPAASPGV